MSGSVLANGGNMETLLLAAKFVEEQEKHNLRRQSVTPRFSEELIEVKEIPVHNGVQSQITSSPIPMPSNPPKHGSAIRTAQKKLERIRRAHLKEHFETLKKQLVPSPDEKITSELSILNNAIRYIAVLERKEREFEQEKERLTREKIAYQQKLVTLKKELTALWEHTDLNILLPEVVDPEPRRTRVLMNGRMTETRSDEELVRTSTMYSSTSSLSSASPLHSNPEPQAHHHHTQVVISPGSPNYMLPADTYFVHSHVPTTSIVIQNRVINHSTVNLATKHPVSIDSSTLVALGLNNHPRVIPRSGSLST